MNGPRPPPGIPAPPLGPLALNLRNQMLRKNTNKRLANLNSIGVSPPSPEHNLPQLSNLAPFPVPESIVPPPSTLSATASNWVPAPPPLPPGPPPLPLGPPPGLPPLPYMASYVATPFTMPSYTATPFTMPSYKAQPSLSPQLLIEFMKNGGRVYINNYPPHLQTELRAIMRQYRSEHGISEHYRDGNSMSKNPYFFISKKTNRPPLRSVGQTQRRRHNKKSSQTRRRR